MIITTGIMVFFGLLLLIFELLPELPKFDAGMIATLHGGIGTILDNGTAILSYFCDFNVLKWCLTIMITIYSADVVFHFIMWLIHKVPFLNIH
jgi:hypothetical protein